MAVNIRSATPADEEHITNLWKECDLVVSYNNPSHDFKFALGRPSSDVFVAVNGAGKIVGTIMVGHDGHRGWFYYLAVAPANRMQGVGRTLVRAGEDWLAQRGVRKVHLMIRETNGGVVRFYEQIGYNPMPRINMQKWLSDPN
jgi:ribosomal protein S18 acetylase RimI-like enzyme